MALPDDNSLVTSQDKSVPQPPEELSASEAELLAGVGRRVRELRERHGLTRKLLAREAGVSERHLANVESGEGNVTILLLGRIAAALNVTPAALLLAEHQDTVEQRLIRRFLERLPLHRLEDVIFRMMRDFGHEEANRRKRIALIGLRGAGKSTLGNLLAKQRGVPLVELNREISRETGLPVSEIMALYGQRGYRRLERQALERIITEQSEAVIVAGGGLVSDETTFELLLGNCFTVWLRATPQEHMSRVIAQGDFRPMSGNDEAMDDLKNILEAREPLYRKADAVVDTSGNSIEESLLKLQSAVMV